MATPDQSFSTLLKNIITDVQELIRSEVRFAKAELHEQANGLKPTALLIGAGALTAIFAVFFALCSVGLALAMMMPGWEAALIMAATLGVAGGFTIRIGIQRLKRERRELYEPNAR